MGYLYLSLYFFSCYFSESVTFNSVARIACGSCPQSARCHISYGSQLLLFLPVFSSWKRLEAAGTEHYEIQKTPNWYFCKLFRLMTTVVIAYNAFGASMLSVGQQEGHPACKN